MTILDKIISQKHVEVKKLIPIQDKLRLSAISHNDKKDLLSLNNFLSKDSLSIIAEVKKASPSAGEIVKDFEPVTIAKNYFEAKADAISVLTDRNFFQGSLKYLSSIRNEVNIPLLRKDFIIHESQIYESVIAGADAILLIAAVLDKKDLIRLFDIASSFQLEVLVEVHNYQDLDKALEISDIQIIGINNRNLKSFKVDIETTQVLAEEIDKDITLVSESGIKTAQDARLVHKWGADAILVGESLMLCDDIPKFIKDIKNN